MLWILVDIDGKNKHIALLTIWQMDPVKVIALHIIKFLLCILPWFLHISTWYKAIFDKISLCSTDNGCCVPKKLKPWPCY
jgi:hypothetical protein